MNMQHIARKGTYQKGFNMNELDVVRDGTGRELEGSNKHIQVLERRRLYLSQRVASGHRDGKNMAHDEHEVQALDWALEQLDILEGKEG